jgi:Zn-dependent peptidase ImmA (M78 family)/transcriptional regulator with XRE-family HTH domain
MTDGERIRQARELRALTQTELAARAGVNQSSIALMEAGVVHPAAPTLEAIALACRFPPSFFDQAPPPPFPEGSLLFRAQHSVAARDRNRARRYGQLVYELALRMADRLEVPTPRIPRLSPAEGPERAAQLTRSSLGLSPDTPIGHLVHELERAGVVIIALPVQLPKQDAFSLWTSQADPTPVIALLAGAPGDRLRFSVAHELGHLAMHQALSGPRKTLEQQANQFAAEFLVPSEAIAAELVTPVTLEQLRSLKGRWGVAIQTLATRARDVGVITDNQRTTLFRQLSARGWRTREPGYLKPEKPRAVRKMAELLYGPGRIDTRRLAVDVAWSSATVEEVLAGHADVADMVATVDQGRATPGDVIRFPKGA